MKLRRPTDAERAEVEALAAIITTDLLDGRGPGFAGAVLTISMSHILSLLDDEMADDCIRMHAASAMALRGDLRARLERMKH